jgi:alcohol dehydrogenase (cytochrome c)
MMDVRFWKISRKRKVLLLGLLFVAFTGLVLVAVPGANWRARVIGLKVSGQLPDLRWRELYTMMGPGSLFYLEPILESRNPFQTIKNPHTSQADIDSGKKAFQTKCAECHGSDGKGAAGPNLIREGLTHGDSDLAIFRVVSEGVAGTGMPDTGLSDQQSWQVVVYLRDLLHGKGAEEVAGVEVPMIDFGRLVNTSAVPGDWLMYSGNYASQRHSTLNQVNADNANLLQLKWALQLQTQESLVETTPLVVGDVMFLTDPTSNVLAVDARSGRTLWHYRKSLSGKMGGNFWVNRGVAVLGDKVYIGTIDAHLVALDARSGSVAWDVEVVEPLQASINAAPLAIDGKIIVGIAGGELGVRGFLDAYDAATGKRIWRFYTVPAPGEPGSETWTGNTWKTGGAPTWLTGSYDPELNLIYWGVGNPAPVFQSDARKGDNLYSNSLIALEAETGKLRWHFQFTPGDDHDWDSNQIPVLVDTTFQGRTRKLLLLANRSGFYYVLDRVTGEFLLAKEFVKQTWAEGINSKGRPIRRPSAVPTVDGTLIWPGVGGGTNWWSPSYSPATRLFYVGVVERPSIFFRGPKETFVRGQRFLGTAGQTTTDSPNYTAIRALAADTGELRWEHRFPARTDWNVSGGLLSTAGGLVFGSDKTSFFALAADTGRELWSVRLGGNVHAGPITFLSDSKQRVSIVAGKTLFVFGLPDDSPSNAAPGEPK